MAQKQKRPSPHDVPPSVSSDEEDEQPIPSSQPRSQNVEEEDADEESSSEEEDEEEDDEEKKIQPESKNPKPVASSESATESDSGSESESESESRGASDYQIQPKPLASKPMDETPLKANSKPSKRPAESNGNGDANRAKKKKVTNAAAAIASSEDNDDDDDGGVEASEVKKSSGAAASDSKNLPFQRLFSEEDEIAILKGMIEFKKDTGNDPFKFADVFHGFMKKWLHIDASSNQLKQKIQRLKRKFEVNAKGKSFSKPHDKEAFELSKKIWGNAGANEVAEKAKSNSKAPKSAMKEGSRGNVAPLKLKSEPKQEVKLLMDLKEEAVNMETDENRDIPLSIAQGFGLYGLNENLMKRGLDLMGASDRAKLEKQWREFEAEEFEASVKRVELVAKHARLIREAYEASNH